MARNKLSEQNEAPFEITPKFVTDVALAAGDFAFEMKVGEILRAPGVGKVKHGGIYLDPIRAEPREFDFAFSLTLGDRCCVQLAVECKNIFPGAPVVISGSLRREFEAYHEIVAAVNGGYKENADTLRHGEVSRTLRVSNSSLYPEAQFVGKNVGKLKPPKGEKKSGPLYGYTLANDSEVYDPWSQAIAHAAALAKDSTSTKQRRPLFTITIPIVAIPDETLWLLEYDDVGVVCGYAESTQSCSVYRDQVFPLETQPGFAQQWKCSHIEFHTVSGLQSLVKKLTTLQSGVWDLWFEQDATRDFASKVL